MDSAKRWPISAADMKQVISKAASSDPNTSPNDPKAARVAPEYAVSAAAMLFMCSPGTKPAANPAHVPASAHTPTDARSPRSNTDGANQAEGMLPCATVTVRTGRSQVALF